MTWRVDNNTIENYISVAQQCLISNNVFDNFRSDDNYTTIISEAMPGNEIDLFYNELLLRPEIFIKLNTLKIMDNIGNPIKNLKLNTAPRNLRYLYNAARIKEYFGDIRNVVEIGVGFGGMCFTMGQVFKLTGYKLLDIPEIVLLARLFLSKLPFNNDDNFFNPDPPYDLCISECGLTELDDDEIKKYYNQYLIKSKHLFIRTNFSSNEEHRFNNFVSMIKHNFKVEMAKDFPDPEQPNTVLFGWTND